MTKKKIPTWANFIKCECGCGTRGYKNLTRVPPIMGGVTFDVPLKKTDRFICSPCIKIWHDGGPVNAADLGKEHKRRKKAGEFPFNGEFAPGDTIYKFADWLDEPRGLSADTSVDTRVSSTPHHPPSKTTGVE
jgi:hypothetical protein